MADWILLPIIAAFVAYEAIAHFVWKNGTRGQTVSWIVLRTEHRYGWPIRALVAAACVVLAVHLEGAF